MIFSVNPDPISGVNIDGTVYDLYCADDGGYWWWRAFTTEVYGPFGLDLPTGPALDEAFAALATI